ncbi:CoA transferase [Williamsia sp. 1138]|uniref:CaiB/BaiF CoA transferase family protein n=1 Tax=Williamsia sp. 1138 TaxID=1903117 RepID=UPI000A1038DB|nr:CoA transferase [Williamsia sp. 1138]OZG26107.1 CoA transferase [Williamsia sp. 1138]
MSDVQAVSRRPLEGITVVDLTVNIAGPSATLILADLGARVIKVEPPGGDVSRSWFPQDPTGTSTVFSAFNRDKESIVIDAKTSRGRELIHGLVEMADVFVESMRPGKAAALGLAWEDLEKINDRLIYCSVNAFGTVGPMAGVAGFDAVIQAYSGLMDLTGHPSGDPARVGGAVIDVGSGVWAALGVVSALMQRLQDGRGRQIETTMLGTAVGYLMHHLTSVRLAGVEPQRLGTAQHNFAPYQAIRAADQMVMIGVNSDAMWQRTAMALGVPELAEDPRYQTNPDRSAHRDELISDIESATSTIAASEVVDRLVAVSVPASVVRPIGALASDPQLDAMKLWGTTPAGVCLPRTPVADPAGSIGDIAHLGEHTVSVLAEIGIGTDDVDILIEARTVQIDPSRAANREPA